MNAQPGRSRPPAERTSGGTRVPATQPQSPTQRWRLTFARERDPDRRTHREVVDAWVAALKESALPLLEASGRFRVPLTFATPLPSGMECREELADLWLRERLPGWQVREAVVPTLPPRVVLLRLDDAWVGAPALAAALRAADYAVSLPDRAAFDTVQAAAARLLASHRLDRARARGSGTVEVDVRPLIESVHVSRERAQLELRTRFVPDRGAGRPEDVLAILESWLDAPIEWGDIVRERLILAT